VHHLVTGYAWPPTAGHGRSVRTVGRYALSDGRRRPLVAGCSSTLRVPPRTVIWSQGHEQYPLVQGMTKRSADATTTSRWPSTHRLSD